MLHYWNAVYLIIKVINKGMESQIAHVVTPFSSAEISQQFFRKSTAEDWLQHRNIVSEF